MALVGYARVSSYEQQTRMQLDALKAAGAVRLYQEKGSSVGARPALHQALASLQRGDVLVVWKLDRIARSLSDLLGIIGKVRASGAAIRSLTEPIDTSTPIGEFTLHVLGAVAQLERSMIRERAIAGQVAAYARGKRWGGQPRALTEKQRLEVLKLKAAGGHTHKQIAALFGCSVATIDRVLSAHRHPDKAKKKRLPVLGRYIESAGSSSGSPPRLQ